MAEIPVEKRSSKAWLWILLALLIVGLLLWWLLSEADEEETDLAEGAVATEQVGAGTAAPGTAEAGTDEMSIAAIQANPSAYYGREGFTGEVTVGEPLTDRGFWIEDNGNRMFALVIDQPREVPIDINPGQTLRLDGGTIREAATISDPPGNPLDENTKSNIADQQAVLVIDEDDIEVVERP